MKTTRRIRSGDRTAPLLPAYPDENRAGAPARGIRSRPAGFAPLPNPENRPAVPATPLLPSPAPARPDVEEEFVIQARHRTRKHRFVLLVEEIVDHPLDREVGPSQRKGLFERNVTHEIGFHAADLRLHAVVRRGEAFAVITPLVNEPPRPVSQPSGHRSRIFGDIDQLLADRLVVPVDRIAVVDRGRPREIAVGVQLPVGRRLPVEPRLQLDAVGVHLLDVLRSPESLEGGQPDDPVVDVGVEPCRLAVQRVGASAPHGERNAAVVTDTVLLFQVGIAARQEIEVVERRETEVTRHGGFGHHPAAVRKHVIGEEGGDDRRPVVAEHLLAQRQRQPQPVRRLVLGRNVTRQLDAPLIVADLHLLAVAAELLRIFHRQDVLVDAFDQMLVHRKVGRKEPLVADGIFALDLAEKRIDPAARADHLRHVAVAERLLELASGKISAI